jgi:hypothetical protein
VYREQCLQCSQYRQFLTCKLAGDGTKEDPVASRPRFGGYSLVRNKFSCIETVERFGRKVARIELQSTFTGDEKSEGILVGRRGV